MQKIFKNLNKTGYFKLTAWFATKTFPFFEKWFGVHLTPANYYSPVPNVSELGSTVFDKSYSTDSLPWDIDRQLHYLTNIFPKYAKEFQPIVNSGLTLVDAFILYAMIREHKPKKIVEVGAGDTTYISLKAMEANRKEGYQCKFVTIEPFPRTDIPQITDPFFQLIKKKIQEVDLDFFKDVDLLFIDSSHVSKLGSDVNYELLEVLPILKNGSLVHFHDIPFPQNYWKDWTETGTMFWNESYLLHAFLLFNDSFKITWASNFMRLNHFKELFDAFPYLNKQHRLSSFWISRVKL